MITIHVKGNTSTLTEDELLAFLCHEAQHTRLWHFPLSLFCLTSLIYLLKPYRLPGLLFARIATRALNVRFKYRADKFAEKQSSKEAFSSALRKLENPKAFNSDLIPILNLLAFHPETEERVNALR